MVNQSIETRGKSILNLYWDFMQKTEKRRASND